MQHTVAALHIHPVKSLRAVDVAQADVTAMGFAGDRRWMLIDAAGRFVSQREDPQLAQLVARLSPTGVVLTLPDGQTVAVPTPTMPTQRAIIWRDSLTLPVAEVPALSAYLGYPVRLAFLPEGVVRHANSDWAGPGARVSLADAYGVLVTTTGSLAALNAHITASGGTPVPMARFRPNLVIEAPAWAETTWRRIKLGSATLDLIKPSDRCVVTTTDQRTGARMGKEPLASLARIRRSADPRINGVLFGENAIVIEPGKIAIGDTVTVLETGSAFPVVG
jgi:uncharacterized protein